MLFWSRTCILLNIILVIVPIFTFFFENYIHSLITTEILKIGYLSLCKLKTSCSCFLSCVTIFSHSALTSWYCSRARASRSSAFCRASFSFSRSASALSRSVVSIDLTDFVQIFLMSFFLAGALHCGHLSFPPLAFNHLSIQLQQKKIKLQSTDRKISVICILQ